MFDSSRPAIGRAGADGQLVVQAVTFQLNLLHKRASGEAVLQLVGLRRLTVPAQSMPLSIVQSICISSTKETCLTMIPPLSAPPTISHICTMLLPGLWPLNPLVDVALSQVANPVPVPPPTLVSKQFFILRRHISLSHFSRSRSLRSSVGMASRNAWEARAKRKKRTCSTCFGADALRHRPRRVSGLPGQRLPVPGRDTGVTQSSI